MAVYSDPSRRTDGPRSNFRWLVLYTVIAFSGFLFLFLKPDPEESVLVFFDSEMSERQTLSAVVNAGGLIVDKAASHRFVIKDSIEDASTFFERLKQQGAWLIVNGENGFGCAATPTQATFANKEKLQFKNLRTTN